ncbi:glycosyltransferase family 25 protein [Pirellulaceae bacterium SH449]
MKTYLINLDRSPDRLAFFRHQAEEVGLTFERMGAIDGKLLPDATWRSFVAKKFEFQPINVFEAAVFLSHKSIWERIVRHRIPMATVFEDDVVLSATIPHTLNAIEQGNLSFDLIKIETTLRSVVLSKQQTKLSSGNSLRSLMSWHGGAAGYVISLEGAEKLSRATNLIADQVDQILFNPLSSISTTLRILQCFPAVCVQKDLQNRNHQATFESTIERKKTRGRLFRHGPIVDLQRLLKKFKQKRLAQRLAHLPENEQIVVPMSGTDSVGFSKSIAA